jgi:hypothetical protein
MEFLPVTAQPTSSGACTSKSMSRLFKKLLKRDKSRHEPSHHDLEKSYTCERCLSIWPGIPDQVSDTEICTIEKSVEELLLSACGVFQLLGSVMREHCKTDPTIAKPTLIRWESYVILNYPGGRGSRGIPRGPATLSFPSVHSTNPEIERLTSSRTSPCLNRRYPVHVDLDQIKRWVNNREAGHSEWRLGTQQRVQGLRLTDCTRRIVVAAQGDCQYMTLSYV